MPNLFLTEKGRRLACNTLSRRAGLVAVLSLALFHLINGCVWVCLDHRIPVGDSQRHMAAALKMRDELRRIDATLLGRIGRSWYPPLTYIVLNPLIELFGPHPNVFAFACVTFFSLSIVVCYAVLAGLFESREIGLIGAFIYGLSNSVYQFSRQMWLETPLALAVLLAAWALVSAHRRKSWFRFLLVSLSLVAAGYVKQPAVLYLAVPLGGFAAAMFLADLRNPEFRNRSGWRRFPISLGRSCTFRLLVAGLLSAALYLPWLLMNWQSQTSLRVSLRASLGGVSMVQRIIDLFAVWPTVFHPFAIVLIVVCLPAALLNWKRPSVQIAWLSPPLVTVLLAIFLSARTRFLIPMAPALAGAIAFGLWTLGRRLRPVYRTVFWLCPALLYLMEFWVGTWGLPGAVLTRFSPTQKAVIQGWFRTPRPEMMTSWRMGWKDIPFGRTLRDGRPPVREPAGYQEVLFELQSAIRSHGGRSVFVVSSPNADALYSAVWRVWHAVISRELGSDAQPVHFVYTDDCRQYLHQFLECDYVVFGTEKAGNWVSAGKQYLLGEALAETGLFGPLSERFEEIARVKSHSGSFVLLRRILPPISKTSGEWLRFEQKLIQGCCRDREIPESFLSASVPE